MEMTSNKINAIKEYLKNNPIVEQEIIYIANKCFESSGDCFGEKLVRLNWDTLEFIKRNNGVYRLVAGLDDKGTGFMYLYTNDNGNLIMYWEGSYCPYIIIESRFVTFKQFFTRKNMFERNKIVDEIGIYLYDKHYKYKISVDHSLLYIELLFSNNEKPHISKTFLDDLQDRFDLTFYKVSVLSSNVISLCFEIV